MSVAFGQAQPLPESWNKGGLIDPVTGILGGVWEQPRLAGFADLFQFAGIGADTGAFGGADSFRHVGGASIDRSAAFAKAVGEGVERYCSAIYDPLEHPLHTPARAPFEIADPALLLLYPPEVTADPDFPFDAVGMDTPMRWVEATDLAGGRLHVPAAQVFVPWYFDIERGEVPFCQPISTGLACHQSVGRAALGGLMEVIERDAFTLTWQTRSPLTEIGRRGLPADVTEIVRRIEATGAAVRIGLAPSDHGVPTIVVTQTIDSGDMPAIALAASSHLSPGVAIRKALEELVHTFRWMFRLMRSHGPIEPGPDYAEIVDQETHMRFWCDPARRDQSHFLWAGDRAEFADLPDLATGRVEDDLAVLAGRLHGVGARPCYVDLTTEDVRPFGLHVVRALIPGFNPLFMGHALRSRTNPRLLHRLARRAAETGQSPDALNNLPHPFP